MEIDGQEILVSMASRGSYKWQQAETLGTKGTGLPVKADGSSLTWFFDFLNDDEWEWWTQTLLGGLDSGEFDSAILYDDDGFGDTFDHCIVYRPVHEKIWLGDHINVTVLITDIF